MEDDLVLSCQRNGLANILVSVLFQPEIYPFISISDEKKIEILSLSAQAFYLYLVKFYLFLFFHNEPSG